MKKATFAILLVLIVFMSTCESKIPQVNLSFTNPHYIQKFATKYTKIVTVIVWKQVSPFFAAI
jgi:hypothetical protein